MLLNLSSFESYAAAGQIRLIAAATEHRLPKLPDVPTVGETLPGFQTSVWFGMWGPAKMPPEILAKIYDGVSKALDLPETRQFFQTNSLERVALSPQDVGKLIHSDLEHWSALAKVVGVKID
jgi:tripartite-type tricarboxylate transporter receptor subunit TctC